MSSEAAVRNAFTPLELPSEPRGVWTMNATLPVSIVVKSSHRLLDPANTDLLRFGDTGPGARRFLVLDSKVTELFGAEIEAYFKAHGVAVATVSIECTEAAKDTTNLFKVLDAMEAFKLKRVGETVLGIGGGVLLDIVGLAATLYRRGVPYVRVPTTLLAIVDASVGVKTGINYLRARNRLGSYFGPVAALLDRAFLRTLPQEELSVGMGEILKMAVVKDATLFGLIEAHGAALIADKFQTPGHAVEVINRSIQGMVEDLEPNLWEKDMKRLVNFGHSFSPVLEMASEGGMAHGQAVALDVLYSCFLSNDRGLLPEEDTRRVFRTMRAVGLPTWHPLWGDQALLAEALADTTRHRNGSQDLPIPVSLGHSIFFDNIRPDEMERASAAMRQMHEDA